MESPLIRCRTDDKSSDLYISTIFRIGSNDRYDDKGRLDDDYSACEQTCKSLVKLDIDKQNDRTMQASSILEQIYAQIGGMKQNFTNYSRKRGHSFSTETSLCESVKDRVTRFISDYLSKYFGIAEELESPKQRRIDDYDSKLKEFRNNLEVEIDIENSEEKCTKNPGHARFIPVKELKTFHFPVNYQDQDLVDSVKLLGDLTVKVSVSVSEGVRTASGKIIDITQNLQNIKCPCSGCMNSKNPRETWWEIEILTVTHIVKEDAKNSKCRLFYDTSDSSLVNVEGFRVVKSSQNSDTCRLICITCDEALFYQITGMLDKFSDLYEKVFEKFWDVKNAEKLVVIVSHPHGTPKKVTIGKSDERKEISDGHSVLTYSTNTCQGSAGAFLYIL